jgi:Tetratricopeptide repeat
LRVNGFGVGVLAIFFVPVVAGQTAAVAPSASKHEANFDTERAQANELFLAGKKLESLPLYEDLCRQDQKVAVFAERHAQGLLVKEETLPDGAAKQAMVNQAVAELVRAQKLGDNSPLVQNLLSLVAKSPVGAIVSGVPLTMGYTYMGKPEAQAAMKDGQVAFGAQNFEVALKAYKHAAEVDPAWYSADLFVGDTYFEMKNYADAGPWFAKAIAIDPDRDTAYRYGGDATFKGGDPAKAKVLYEQAVVAEPYSRPGWNALQQWVTATKTQIPKLQIVRPNYTTNDGKLTVDPALASETGDGHASWLVYENARVAHGGLTPTQAIVAGATMADGTFQANGYRHSLAEETESLNAMLADVQAKLKAGTVTEEKLEPSIKNLLRLQKDGMIECWILLNASDAGIRYDYPAYRKGHRELLVGYVDKYVLGQTQ